MKWIEVKIELNNIINIENAAALSLLNIDDIEIVDAFENMQHIENNKNSWDYIDENLLNLENPTSFIKFYLPEITSNDKISEIAAAVAPYGSFSHCIVEDNWTDAWREHYKPFKIGKNIVIAPIWEEYVPQKDDIVFKIEPGHVFGTGQHQSTAMCIELLEEYVKQDAKMLDIGCGSGILGIIAILIGAKHITAVDIDPAAKKVCYENAGYNAVSQNQFNVIIGNILDDSSLISGRFNIITANIVAAVIIPLVPIIKELLAQDGIFIASGILDLDDKADDVANALVSHGFSIISTTKKDNWVAIAAKL